ncbi:MAG: penicillin acylase family protein [Candidatus Hodarchaeota archaeon]
MINKLLGGILKFFIKIQSKKSLPIIDGKLEITGLEAPVEVIRDKWGIPHIYADNEHDLFLALGFTHAQDRLWQMELHRRLVEGRLSEIFGKIALDTDRAIRTFGLARLGEADWDAADDRSRLIIQSYSDGVNAFLNHPESKLPVEFGLIKHKPEPWSPLDTAAFSRFFVWQLEGAFVHLPYFQRLIDKVGKDAVAELDPLYPKDNPCVLTGGMEFNLLGKDGALKGAKGPFIKRGGGSNAWAISGSRTTTGSPIHCNDPHLAPSLPSIWYMQHLVGGGYNLTGVTPPGLPLILIGHNDFCSWGFTVAMVDSEDLFIEKINPDNPDQYEFKGEWKDVEIVKESIKVKGNKEPFIENVRLTKHGPIISDAIGYNDKVVSIESLALRALQVMNGARILNTAKSWDDFVEAMSYLKAPQQNVTYADIEGNIGSYVCGRVPVRAKGDGSLPVPGWTGEYDWTGEVPFEEMPHCLNPKKGYIVTANNRCFPDDYPYFVSRFWVPGWRARRISELIESKDKVSIEDCKKFHMDFVCMPGLEFVKKLEGFESQDPDVQLALEQLRAWDGNMTASCIGGTIYEVVHDILLRNILEPKVGKELAENIIGVGFHPMLKSTTERYHTNTLMLFNVLDNPDSWWAKQAGGRNTLLEKSFKDAVTYLKKKLGKNQEKWHWGKLHKISFPHSMSVQKPMDVVFNAGPRPIGGNKHTVAQFGMDPANPYKAPMTWIPSYRHIVNLGNLDESYTVYAPGQSGHLASPHYKDLFELWLKGEYIPMLWSREKIEENTEGKLLLQ